jgi:cytochrome c peroxidase
MDFVLEHDRLELARQRAAITIPPRHLGDEEIRDLVAFLQALTGDSVHSPPFGVPAWFTP